MDDCCKTESRQVAFFLTTSLHSFPSLAIHLVLEHIFWPKGETSQSEDSTHAEGEPLRCILCNFTVFFPYFSQLIIQSWSTHPQIWNLDDGQKMLYHLLKSVRDKGSAGWTWDTRVLAFQRNAKWYLRICMILKVPSWTCQLANCRALSSEGTSVADRRLPPKIFGIHLFLSGYFELRNPSE